MDMQKDHNPRRNFPGSTNNDRYAMNPTDMKENLRVNPDLYNQQQENEDNEEYPDSPFTENPNKLDKSQYVKCEWTSDEDNKLTRFARDGKNPSNWEHIAEVLPGKTESQCQSRWEKLKKAELYEKSKKKPWTEEEDKMVIDLVRKHGPQKWTFIADHLPGRVGKQCRERWHNHLNPNIKKSAWTDEEEWVLFLSHKAAGSKWAEIAKNIPGRTDNSIKNHWNSSMKKKMSELITRFIKFRESGGLKNPLNTVNMTETEYSLLDKLLSMGDTDYHTMKGISVDKKLNKSLKNSINIDPKDRMRSSQVDLKPYNSFGQMKIEDMPLKMISDNMGAPQNMMANSLKQLQNDIINNRDPKIFENICNLVKMNLDYSIQDYHTQNPDQFRLLDQLYNPQHFQSLFHAGQPSLPSTGFDFPPQPYFGDKNRGLTLNDQGSFMVKKEHEYPKENLLLMQSKSPIIKFEPKTYRSDPLSEQYMPRNDETRPMGNFSNARGDTGFESPIQRKKVKVHHGPSPNMLDNENLKGDIKLSEKPNKRAFQTFAAFGYSPLNLKYESPSKMMDFCTPERPFDSSGKPLFFTLNPADKSPSLFMNNKNFYTFDKSSMFKF